MTMGRDMQDAAEYAQQAGHAECCEAATDPAPASWDKVMDHLKRVALVPPSVSLAFTYSSGSGFVDHVRAFLRDLESKLKRLADMELRVEKLGATSTSLDDRLNEAQNRARAAEQRAFKAENKAASTVVVALNGKDVYFASFDDPLAQQDVFEKCTARGGAIHELSLRLARTEEANYQLAKQVTQQAETISAQTNKIGELGERLRKVNGALDVARNAVRGLV